jgi:hypothetical protein
MMPSIDFDFISGDREMDSLDDCEVEEEKEYQQ